MYHLRQHFIETSFTHLFLDIHFRFFWILGSYIQTISVIFIF